MIKAIIISMISVLILCTHAFGAGFALYEQSARGVALGGAFVAQADDPSALYYNPAGITQIQGTWLMAGFSPVAPRRKITDNNGVVSKTKDKTFYPPHIYITRQLNETFWMGFALFSPFGLSTEFNSNWRGRYNSYKAKLETVTLNPNLGIKVDDNFSVAAGFSIQRADATLRQKISPEHVIQKMEREIKIGIAQKLALSPNSPEVDLAYKTQFLNSAAALDDIDQELKGDDIALGFNIAIHYKASDRLRFGITYRSEITQKLDGSVSYGNCGKLPEAGFDFSDYFYNAPGTAKLRIPDSFSIGAAYQINPKLTVEADIWITGWSSYNELPIHLENKLGDQTKIKNYKDVWSFRCGVEYKYSDIWTGRLGYVYDKSPIPDETIDYLLPSNDRHQFNTGIGFKYGKYLIDAFYSYLIITDRHIDERPQDFIFEGEAEGYAHLCGLSLSYNF